MSKILHLIYPFLIAIYPVLALRNFNIDYVDLPSILRSLIIVLGLTALVWLVLHAIFRDAKVSGILASLAIITVLSYGHIYLQMEKVLGEPIRHLVLASLFVGIFLFCCWILVKKPSLADGARQFLSNTAVILVLLALGQSVIHDLNSYGDAQAFTSPSQANADTNLPDIYVLVLDGHGRSDVLREEFDYDNSAFINELTDMGFYVADCSQSNYASTRYSLTSMFQMDYIELEDGKERVPALKNTVLLRTLRENGYSILTFENYASGHFDLAEDLRLSRHQISFGTRLGGAVDLSGGLNEFEKTLLNTSITRLFLDTEIIPGFNENALVRLEYYEHYLQTKYILDALPEIARLKGPKFVFVHMLVPHIPHVFTPDGEFRYPDDPSRNGYRDNAMFIDQALVPVLNEILAESDEPPVIVLMGDHGPPATKFTSPEARMKILNAYYVNSNAESELYDSVTPINSFRIVLNEYFGSDYPLLEDISYYAYQQRQLRQPPAIIENVCSRND
ncbi:MAG TPA: sulfatase-like hydrolase/transferase [Anaerolineales bacterium]|nr:sulfatase-like hydrolase/transferase [Anaerolineales bacterium]